MTERTKARWAGAAVLALAGLCGCGFTNAIQPLRGEDAQALKVAGERQDFLSKTGASRTVEAFRAAAREGEWGKVLGMLAPGTRAVVERRAQETGASPEKVLEGGVVPGVELPGVEDPIRALAADGKFFAGEDAPFDATRRKASVTVRTETRAPFQVPLLFLDEAWRLELVRTMDIPAARPGS